MLCLKMNLPYVAIQPKDYLLSKKEVDIFVHVLPLSFSIFFVFKATKKRTKQTQNQEVQVKGILTGRSMLATNWNGAGVCVSRGSAAAVLFVANLMSL